mmetsp:Transcript_68902/g.151896  ORF Transcript_68902/g.151896 Transcript_68902/m.151896 type:complete len:380 (+) Transcript_68902:644-1783(+)
MEGIVDGGIREQVGSQGLYLHLLRDHGFHLLPILWVVGVNVVPKLQPLQLSAGLGPITSLQILRSGHHGVLGGLRWSRVLLLVISFQCTPQNFRNDPLVAWIDGLHGDVWHLQQHGADVLRTLQHLQVDVHVVGQLPLPLGPFLFLASFHVLGIGEALSQELPALVVLTHVHEAVVGLCDLSQAEGAQADLGDDTVVEDLRVHIGFGGLFLEVAKMKQVPSWLEAVVQRQMICLAEARPTPQTDISCGPDIVAEFAHVRLGIVRPHPVRFRLFWHGVRDRIVDTVVQCVRLVVQLFHEPGRNGAQVLWLLDLFEVAQGAVQQDQTLRGIAQNFMVFGAVDITVELKSFVQLIIQFLDKRQEQVLQSWMRLGILHISVTC